MDACQPHCTLSSIISALVSLNTCLLWLLKGKGRVVEDQMFGCRFTQSGLRLLIIYWSYFFGWSPSCLTQGLLSVCDPQVIYCLQNYVSMMSIRWVLCWLLWVSPVYEMRNVRVKKRPFLKLPHKTTELLGRIVTDWWHHIIPLTKTLWLHRMWWKSI